MHFPIVYQSQFQNSSQSYTDQKTNKQTKQKEMMHRAIYRIIIQNNMKDQKPIECSLGADCRINKLRYIHTGKYYPSVKRNEMHCSIPVWRKLQIISQVKISEENNVEFAYHFSNKEEYELHIFIYMKKQWQDNLKTKPTKKLLIWG